MSGDRNRNVKTVTRPSSKATAVPIGSSLTGLVGRPVIHNPAQCSAETTNSRMASGGAATSTLDRPDRLCRRLSAESRARDESRTNRSTALNAP